MPEAPGRPGGRMPVPDDALDALVTVLDDIRLGRSRSRSELVDNTGLGRGVVAQRVGELLERGLVVEGEVGPSTGGRPPRQLSFRGDAGHILVADLGATSIDVAATTLDGRVLAHHAEPADIGSGPEVCLGRVEELFRELDPARHGLPGRLWGVGIAVPGPVEFRTGRPTSPPIMPGWDGYPIRERFAARYAAPVWVDNDVNALALGEWRAGVAVDHDDVVVIKVGTGIGAGIISEGRIHRGAQGSAGDVGHIQVVDDRVHGLPLRQHRLPRGPRGWRGAGTRRRGCRPLGSERAPGAGARGRLCSISARDVALAAAHGDPVSVELLQEAGRRVGQVLASIVNFFNPSLIVIGGGVAQSGDQFLATIRETIYRRSLPLATRDLVIARSALGGLAGVIGASSMVVDQLFLLRLPGDLDRGRRALRHARGGPGRDG